MLGGRDRELGQRGKHSEAVVSSSVTTSQMGSSWRSETSIEKAGGVNRHGRREVQGEWTCVNSCRAAAESALTVVIGQECVPFTV